ncbi:polyprenyl synthetase family protein [Candidatus Woesearchaeota archaeon]|nr:polyprenyl synthetase family protein [Candidatus Woesearchaeota archaeon]
MEFEQILEKYRSTVDKEINRFFERKIEEAEDRFLKTSYKYLKGFVLRPGKRIRPIAAIMAYKAIKEGNEEQIYPVSISPELFHASSLIHDDIMDEDMLRRNKKTMHRLFEDYFKKNFRDKMYNGSIFDSYSKRFSVSMGIIQGNMLYSLSFSSILDSKLDEKMKSLSLGILNKGYCKTNEGQIFDLTMAANEKADEKGYTDMAMGKTASPLSAAILFGATLNNATPFQIEQLEKYSLLVGLAFQIQDDIIDISEGMKKGRGIGSDLKRGNKTLIVMKALQEGNEKQRKLILNVVGNDKATNSEVIGAIKTIEETNSLKYASDYANNRVNEAKKYLKKAKLTREGCEFFSNFADYVVRRKT